MLKFSTNATDLILNRALLSMENKNTTYLILDFISRQTPTLESTTAPCLRTLYSHTPVLTAIQQALDALENLNATSFFVATILNTLMFNPV